MLLQNSHITLRALEPEDLEVLYRWENDAALWFTGNTVAPYSRYDLKQYIASAPKNIYEHGFIKLIIERVGDKERLGVVDLFDYDHHNSRAEVGVYIDASHRRAGYGLQAVELITDYGLNFLHLNQLYCHIPASNAETEALFSKAGYQRTALLPRWIKTPEGYADVVMMCYHTSH